MAFDDKEILDLLKKYQYLDAVKRYEEKYGVTMREALSIIRPLWREVRGRGVEVKEHEPYSDPEPTVEPPVQKPISEETAETTVEDLQGMAEELLEDAEALEAQAAEDLELEIEEMEIEPPPAPKEEEPTPADAIIELLAKGDMEGAARVYERTYNVSITEAINEVFKWKKNLDKQAKEEQEQSESAEYQSGQSYTISPEIIELVKQGKKIEAVKRFREIYNTSLKDSKHFIDQIADRL